MSHPVRPNIVREPTPGYRANVAVCVSDLASGKVLGFQRCDHCSWQFPQGGIDHGETPVEAAFRELYEETGITSDAVELVHELKGWVHYDWPKKRQREKRAMGATNWKGQRQKWFLMKAQSAVEVECCIDLSGLGGAPQEFCQFAWFHIEDMLPLCRDFKRGAYAYIIREIQPLIEADRSRINESHRDGVHTSSSVEALKFNLNASQITPRETTATCTLDQAVQENALPLVVAVLVQKHGSHAVQAVLNGMDSPARTTQQHGKSGLEGHDRKDSIEHDDGHGQTNPSSGSRIQEDSDAWQ